MKLITRYVAGGFVRFFALSLTSLMGLFVLVAVFEGLRTFLKNNASFEDAFLMIVSQTPYMATQVIPFSALIGALATLAIMAKSGELTVLRSAGIPLRKLSTPFLVGGIILTGITFSLQEYVVPHTNALFREVKNVRIKGRSPEKLTRSTDVWIKSDGNFVHTDLVTGDQKKMIGIKVFEVEGSSVRKTITADEAIWDGGRWILSNVVEIDTTAGAGWRKEETSTASYPIAPPPEEIYISRTMPGELSMAELGKSIRSQRAQGLNVTSLEVDFWAKSSTPFACILLPLLSIPFASRVSARSGLWGAITSGIGLGLLYYLILMLGISLGRTGFFPPWFAAWLPNLLFAALCIHMMRGAEIAR